MNRNDADVLRVGGKRGPDQEVEDDAGIPAPGGTATVPQTGGRTVTAEPDRRHVQPAAFDHDGECRRVDLPTKDPSRYQLIGEHGRGGIGRVLTAFDEELERNVAVKELHHVNQVSEARFIREAKITARLEHPSIVPVHEAGRWPDGTPFYAMKLIAGRSLKQLIEEADKLEDRLKLLPNVLAVAEAIAYAHSEGVIHRDLKPSNVIVGDYGETIVIDWGLAKDLRVADNEAPDAGPYRSKTATDASDLTHAGDVLGTPAYMPPEQACGMEVDERADVYALGAMLYHVLAGRPPYQGPTSADVLSKVLSQRGPNPINRVPVPTELVAIVNKAMATGADDRYFSAGEYAADLRRYQNGRLVEAHKYTKWQLILRFWGRHRLPLSIAALAVVLGVAGAVVSVSRIVRERDAARLAEQRQARERNRLILVQARRSLDRDPTASLAWLAEYRGKNVKAAREIALDAVSRGVSHAGHKFQSTVWLVEPVGPNEFLVFDDEKLIVWDQTNNTTTVVDEDLAYFFDIDFTEDRGLAAYLKRDGAVGILDTTTLETSTLQLHSAQVVGIKLSADGSTLLTADAAGVVVRTNLLTDDAQRVGELLVRPRVVYFSPDLETTVVCATDNTLWVAQQSLDRVRQAGSWTSPDVRFSRNSHYVMWASKTQVHVLDLRAWNGPLTVEAAAHPARIAGFSDNAEHFATVHQDNALVVWSVVDGKPVERVVLESPATTAAFDRHGRVIVGTTRGAVELLDLRSGSRATLAGHDDAITSVSSGTSDGLVVSGCSHGEIRVWRAPPLPRTWRAETGGPVFSMTRVKAGRFFAEGRRNGTLRLWDTESGESRVLGTYEGAIRSVALATDGKRVVFGTTDGMVRSLDVNSGTPPLVLAELGSPISSVAFAPHDIGVGASAENGHVVYSNLLTGMSFELRAPGRRARGAVQFDATGSRVAAASSLDGVCVVDIWSTEDGRLLSSVPGAFFAFGPETSEMVTISVDGTVSIRDLDGQKNAIIGQIVRPPAFQFIKFTPSGDKIAWIDGDLVRLFDRSTGASDSLDGNEAKISYFDFLSRDSELVTVGYDGTVRIWSRSQDLLAILRGHRRPVHVFVETNNGQTIVSSASDEVLKVWDLSGHVESVPIAPEQFANWLNQAVYTLPPDINAMPEE